MTWSYPELLRKHYLNLRLYEDSANSETIACVIYNRYDAAVEDAFSMSVNAILTGVDGQTLTNKLCDDFLVAPNTPECSPTSGNVINHSHSMFFSETDGFCFSNLGDGLVRLQFTNMQFFRGVAFQGPDGQYRDYEFSSPTLPPFMNYNSLDQNGLTLGGSFELYLGESNKIQQVGPPNSPSVTPSPTPSMSFSPTPLPEYEVRLGPAVLGAEMFDMPRFTEPSDIAFINAARTVGSQVVWPNPELLRKHWLLVRFYEDIVNSETTACFIYNRYDAVLEDAFSMSAEALVISLNGRTLTNKLCDDFLSAPDSPECIMKSGTHIDYKHSMYFSENDGFCFANLQDGPVQMQFWNMYFFYGISFQGPAGQFMEYEFASPTLTPFISYFGLDQNDLSISGSFSLFIDVANKLQQVTSPMATPIVNPAIPSYEVRIGPAASDAEMFDMPRFTDSADLFFMNQAQTASSLPFRWSEQHLLRKPYLHVRFYEDIERSATFACVI